MKILLSIKPEFVEEIFSGRKKFEYRKAIFTNKKVTSVIVYSTMPVGKIVASLPLKRFWWMNLSRFGGKPESSLA